MSHTRREFIKHGGAGLAGLSLLSPKLLAASVAKPTGQIPPHQGSVVPGVHGYAEQSVVAGEKIHFRVSSTVPHRLAVYRLGLEVESPEKDELVHTFPAAGANPQPIHPGSYVEVAKNLSGAFPALTVECWIRPWTIKHWSGLITQGDSTGGMEFGLFAGPAGSLAFCVGDAAPLTDPTQQITATSGLKANTWHHVAATWNGRERTIFIDGKPAGSWPAVARLTVGKAPLRLGASGQGGMAAHFLDGDVAMPVVYRRALSPTEIAARFAAKALTRPTGADVAACWPLDEDQGERVADASGNGHHGRIINHGTRMIPGPSLDNEIVRFASYDPRQDPRRGHAVRFASDDLYDCRWSTTYEFTVPAKARSGFHVGRIAYEWEGKPCLYHITFIVKKAARAKKAPLVLVAPTNTWRAYCSVAFPQSSAQLRRNVGTAGQPNSAGDPPAFSFYRRHAAGQGTYQLGLRMPFVGADPYLLYGAEYSHLIRADRFTQTWLEKAGYDYDVISDLDLHREPDVLLGYRAVLVTGHSEYWSMPAYRGLENYLNRGGNLAVLSGNTMLWRVTFSADEAILECRKVDAPGEQMKSPDRAECWHAHDGQRGGIFRESGSPSYKLIGLDMLGFVREQAFGPYVVDQPDHFLYHQPEETGLKAGEEFGQGPEGKMPRANGHEMDIRMSTFAALQEQPTPAGATMPSDPPGMTRIANGITRWSMGGSAFDYFFRRLKNPPPQGAEMIYWERAEGGKIFNTGAIGSGWALASDPKFQTLMRNVFAHFGVTRR